MKSLVAAIVLFMTLTEAASAQVPAQFNYQGSAVCPEGHDYFHGLCYPRGYRYGQRRYGGRYYGGDGRYAGGVPPRWNYLGSAVCPESYDYYAHVGLCLPR